MISIEIDDDVFAYLQEHARPFVDTPSSTLRRLIESSDFGRRHWEDCNICRGAAPPGSGERSFCRRWGRERLFASLLADSTFRTLTPSSSTFQTYQCK